MAQAARAAAGAGAFCNAVILCSEGLKMKPEDARASTTTEEWHIAILVCLS